MLNFLGFSDKTFLVTGFANRKSVAWHVSNILEKEGASIIFTVRTNKGRMNFLLLNQMLKLSYAILKSQMI